jgi:hypothetical protein
MRSGWICAGCGAGYAPWVEKCGTCGVQVDVAPGSDRNAGPCRHVPGDLRSDGQHCVFCGEWIPPVPPITITCGSWEPWPWGFC